MNLSADMNTVPFARPLVEIQPQQQQECSKMRDDQNLLSLRKDVASTPSTSHQVQQQAARRLWWQKSIVRRSFANIEKEVNNLIFSSPYLQQHYCYGADDVKQQDHFLQRGIAKFHRDEIITGPILGKGGFSQVMEIVAFQLIPEVSQQCTIEEEALRQQYVASVYDAAIGKNRYCIKHLQEKIVRGCSGRSSTSSKKNEEFQLAASDLYIESVTLSVLQHENIISIRGLPIHGLQSWKTGLYDSYFIIMDQLSTTLDQKIEGWKTSQSSTSNINNTRILQEKAHCAYQLAMALQYIHSNRLLYRDLKPHNIGFLLQDPSKIQLFDFGLCRELPTLKNLNDSQNLIDGPDDNDVYEMSGVGTRRYMAPEIVTIGQYNQKADVYSWSMVFYELLTCAKPYVTYTTEEHTTHVCFKNERPTIPLSFPYWIHSILQHAWDGNISLRSSIHEVSQQLEAALAKCGSYVDGQIIDKELRERSSINHELYITNHDSLISKEYTLPNSPTGVYDFPTITHRDDPQADTFHAMTYANNDNESESSHSFHAMGNSGDTHVRREQSGSTDIRFMQNQDSMVDLTIVETKPRQLPLTTSSSTALVNRCRMTPPAAPKRAPTLYVQVPDDLVRTFELSLSDDDDDMHLSKTYSGVHSKSVHKGGNLFI